MEQFELALLDILSIFGLMFLVRLVSKVEECAIEMRRFKNESSNSADILELAKAIEELRNKLENWENKD